MSSTSPTLFNKRLGAAVRAKRTLAGLSQQAVGDALGVSFQQVQKYELGVNRISVETLIKLATAISATPQELIDAASNPDAPIAMPQDRMSLEIVRHINRLPQKSQKIARNVIKALAEDEAA